MARIVPYQQYRHEMQYPKKRTQACEGAKLMLSLIIFFIAGILLGLIGMRLLNIWEARGQADQHHHLPRHHS